MTLKNGDIFIDAKRNVETNFRLHFVLDIVNIKENEI